MAFCSWLKACTTAFLWPLTLARPRFFNTVNTPRATASLQPDMRKDCFLCSTIVLLAFTKANYRVRLFGLRSTLLHSARRLPGGVHDVHDKISCSRVSNVIQVHSQYTGCIRANCKFLESSCTETAYKIFRRSSMFFKWPLWGRNSYIHSRKPRFARLPLAKDFSLHLNMK